MNIQVGAGRMKQAGIWLAVIGVCWRAPAVCFQKVVFFPLGGDPFGHGVAIARGLLIEEIILAAVPGALLWIAAWIVEGFAKEPD
jgi:hypothetical protein